MEPWVQAGSLVTLVYQVLPDTVVYPDSRVQVVIAVPSASVAILAFRGSAERLVLAATREPVDSPAHQVTLASAVSVEPRGTVGYQATLVLWVSVAIVVSLDFQVRQGSVGTLVRSVPLVTLVYQALAATAACPVSPALAAHQVTLEFQVRPATLEQLVPLVSVATPVRLVHQVSADTLEQVDSLVPAGIRVPLAIADR